MINKIVSLIICLFIYSTALGNSLSSTYVIIQDNNDSTVNVREKESLHASVLAKVPNGTPMSCSFDNSNNHNFCFVRFGEHTKISTGYIYKNKLVFLDNDKSFNKIPLSKSDLYSAIYKHNEIIVNIKLAAPKLKNKDFSWHTTKDGAPILMYQHQRVYGTDNEITDSVFVYSSIDIDINGSNYSIPLTKCSGLFIPTYFVENQLVFKYISIYHNVKDNLMYIFSTQSDGAAIYTVVFELKNNLLIKTHVWNESY